MSDRISYRDEIAAEIIARIEAGTAPWMMPWDAGTIGTGPFNPITNKAYRGINDLWLGLQGRSDPRWMTYKQAAGIDAQVRKGEKSATIEYWQWTDRIAVTDQDGKPVLDAEGKQRYRNVQLERPRVFYAKVFNAEQIDGLEPFIAPPAPPEPERHALAETLLAGSGVPVLHDQNNRAFYRIITDDIHMPPRNFFKTAEAYYETALHELGHATGHQSRLKREFGPFGGEVYAREELRAEIASYMLARDMGISFDPSNHAAYVESWLRVLKDDKNEIFRAARDAETIKTWVMEPERRPELERGVQGIAAPEQAVQEPVAAQQQSIAPNAENRVVTEVKYLDRLENYFRPGRIVPAYIGNDEVIAFRRTGNIGWKVDVRSVDYGDRKVRTHSTYPQEKALADWEKDNPPPKTPRVYLTVPFAEKDEVKRLGARWDNAAKSWYVPVDLDAAAFARWHKDKAMDIPKDLKLYVDALQAANTQDQHKEALGDLIIAVAELSPERRAEVMPLAETFGITEKQVNEFAAFSERQAAEDRATDQAISEYLSRQTEIAEDIAFKQADRYQQAQDQAQTRTYIAVPFAEKNEAKALGAKWDRQEKSWYVPEDKDAAAFAKWTGQAKAEAPSITPQEEFAQALKAAGFLIKGVPEMDGEWHRCMVEGDKKGPGNGSYRGFLDGRPAGQINNFRAGGVVQWVSTGTVLTDEDRAKIQAEAAQVRAERAAAQLEKAEKAAKKAYGVWQNLPGPATRENSVYLAAKGVGGHGVKINQHGHMVVPCRDADGRLWNIQTVTPDGKLFLKDSHKMGTMHVIEVTGKGTLDSLRPLTEGAIIIAEGYATAASIHQATGRAVIAAFDSGNLQAVGEAVRAKYPDRPILFAADNDHANPLGNVGTEKALAAAQAVGGSVVSPRFTPDEMSRGLSDFNDLALSRGNPAVGQAVEAAISRMRGHEQERSIA